MLSHARFAIKRNCPGSLLAGRLEMTDLPGERDRERLERSRDLDRLRRRDELPLSRLELGLPILQMGEKGRI